MDFSQLANHVCVDILCTYTIVIVIYFCMHATSYNHPNNVLQLCYSYIHNSCSCEIYIHSCCNARVNTVLILSVILRELCAMPSIIVSS